MTPPRTIGDAVRTISTQLEKAGIENATSDARLIVGHATALSRSALIGHPEQELASSHWNECMTLAGRRAAHEPISHLTGEREFWSLPFRVTPDTLIPRPDSETLIEAVLQAFKTSQPPRRILDIGTGSGCLLAALLHEWPEAHGLGLDVNEGAVDVARKNLEELSLDARAVVMVSDWRAYQPDQTFDLVISNPPYIPTKGIKDLEPDVRDYEPHLALDGGPDGLDHLKAIAAKVAGLVRPGGRVAVEFGIDQSHDVGRLFRDEGLSDIEFHQDLGGIERCLLATVPN